MDAEKREMIMARLQEVRQVTAPVLADSMYCPTVGEDGVVGRYLFAGSGMLQGASAFCEEMPEGGKTLTLEATLEHDNISTTVSYTISAKGGKMEIDTPVSAGTRLTIRTTPGAQGVWVGFLWMLGV